MNRNPHDSHTSVCVELSQQVKQFQFRVVFATYDKVYMPRPGRAGSGLVDDSNSENSAYSIGQVGHTSTVPTANRQLNPNPPEYFSSTNICDNVNKNLCGNQTVAETISTCRESYATSANCTGQRILNTRVSSRAVRIELFTARVLYRVSHRVLEYSMDTGSSY